jgi:DNA-binding transcriptional LysR family regulator
MLELLETFCAVAEAGSLTRAAERLHITQPAITRQLRALERRLGAILVTRTPQGATLTPAGLAVLVHAREAVAAVRACRAAALEASAAGSQRLRIATGLMAMLYVLPPVVARFRTLNPNVEVDLQPAHQRVAVERLLGYEVDAAVIASPVRNPMLRATPILHDPLLLIGAPNADDTPIPLAGLQGTTLLVLPSGTGLHEQIAAALRSGGITCHLVEYPTAETIKTSVALGMGATILPASAVLEDLRAGTLTARPLAGWPGAARVIQILVRAEGRPPPPVATFTRLLKDHYARSALTPCPSPELGRGEPGRDVNASVDHGAV